MFDLEIQVLKKECSEGNSMPPHLHHYKNITIANVNSGMFRLTAPYMS